MSNALVYKHNWDVEFFTLRRLQEEVVGYRVKQGRFPKTILLPQEEFEQLLYLYANVDLTKPLLFFGIPVDIYIESEHE